ncbi:MAG: deoxyguanosinetriphosphate triphosphohydrolase [Fibrobacterales bacterium]
MRDYLDVLELGAMEWERLLNSDNMGNNPSKFELGRSPFNADHDKIMFSGAFRRLAKKTQVHPLATNDHIHNRLTHSLEVSCVGRSLGLSVAQKLREKERLTDDIQVSYIGDIVQSACLAHDIGNPPFGHTGEEAIQQWFLNEGSHFLTGMSDVESKDLQSFEGNAQGLRVLTTVENHLHNGGLRLTNATLAAFIKYPWTSQYRSNNQPLNKFGVFHSELELFHDIAQSVGLIPLDEHRYCRHPLVHLMEAADDFCYGIIDLEDGLEMNILEWDEVYGILEPVIPEMHKAELTSKLAQVDQGRKNHLLRGVVMDTYIKAASDAFVAHEEQYLEGDDTNLIDLCGEAIKRTVKGAKKMAREQIFSHPRKVELEIGAYNSVATLLQVICSSALEWSRNPHAMSYTQKRVIELIGEKTFHPDIISGENKGHSRDYMTLMRVVDFVSGMTDNYATYLAKQLQGF